MKCKRFFAVLLSYVLIFCLSVPVSAAELATEEIQVEESAEEVMTEEGMTEETSTEEILTEELVTEEIMTEESDGEGNVQEEALPELMEMDEVLVDVSGSDAMESEAEVEEIQPVEEELPLYNVGSSFATATAINLGERYENVWSNNYGDYYSFTLEQSGRVTIDLTATHTVWFYLYDSERNQIFYKCTTRDSITGLNDNTYTFDLTQGTYYMEVEGVNGYNYYFTTTFESAGETIPETEDVQNNSVSTAFPVSTGMAYNGQIAYNDSSDYYKFTLANSSKVAINLTAAIQELSYYIYNSNGTLLTYKNASWNQATEMLSHSSDMDLISGDYYIEIRKKNNYTGNYAFSLMTSSAGESFKESKDKSDNTLPKANSILTGTVYVGQLAHNDEKDFYKIYIGAPGKLVIDVNAGMAGINLGIYNSNGEDVWSDSVTAAVENVAFSRAVELSAGTYYIGVSRYAEYANYTGAYSFRTSMHYHTYTTTTTKATLTQNGSIITKCACGMVKSHTIIGCPITIQLSKETCIYDGKAKKPSVVVKDVYGNVISSANYTVSYASGRKNVGKYKQ